MKNIVLALAAGATLALVGCDDRKQEADHRAATEKTAPQKPAAEKPGADKATAEKAALLRGAAEKTGADKPTAERAGADKASVKTAKQPSEELLDQKPGPAKGAGGTANKDSSDLPW
jgi:hypothetical protein